MRPQRAQEEGDAVDAPLQESFAMRTGEHPAGTQISLVPVSFFTAAA